ncbi:MAG: pilus assembly protein [Sphingomonadales bacterium]|nr:pilus assembly protein [Sphingomonadales bacterium]MBD3773821.1 pilus assembly protein [Paracoccaceae bacterium]
MIARFASDRSGSPAAEFVLMLPIMLALLFGTFEAGHFFWTQHKIVKAVRDGARYASRLNIQDKLCNGATSIISTQTIQDIQNVTATGQLAAGGVSKVPGWAASNVQVTLNCASFVDTGIYTDLGGKGPLVTISSGNVDYPSLFMTLGFINSTVKMSAKSSAAVVGL